VHLVAHSKGGLDCRYYLAEHYGEVGPSTRSFDVLSLTTLGTPHNGSVLADVMHNSHNPQAQRNQGRVGGIAGGPLKPLRLIGFPDGFATVVELANFNGNGTNKGHPSLRVDTCSKRNSAELFKLPRDTEYYAIAANMDADGSWHIDDPYEVRRLKDTEEWNTRFAAVASMPLYIGGVDKVYQTLLRTQTIQLSLNPASLTASGVGVIPGRRSDVLVTIDSGLGLGSFATISSARPAGLSPNWYPLLDGEPDSKNHQVISSDDVAYFPVFTIVRDVERRKGNLR